MQGKYYQRKLESSFQETLKEFPAVLITGPRQAGKSTFLKHCLSDYTYVTLDSPTERAMALEDPELFFETHPTPLINLNFGLCTPYI